jgi:hypothetical protein
MCADSVFDFLISMVLKKKVKKFKNDYSDFTCFVIGQWLNKLKFVRKMRLGKDINLDEKANVASNMCVRIVFLII